MVGRCWGGIASDQRSGKLHCCEGNSFVEFADLDDRRRWWTIAPHSRVVRERKLNGKSRFKLVKTIEQQLP